MEPRREHPRSLLPKGDIMKTDTDHTAYLEMARIAMAAIPEDIADNLDISDTEFLRLREKLQKELEE